MPEELDRLEDTLVFASLEDEGGQGENNNEHGQEALLDEDLSSLSGDVWDGLVERHQNGQVVVYTDGACINNQDHRFRRAGYSAFWYEGSAKNWLLPLHGWCQTNQRAELSAILYLLRSEERPVHIKSDSAYC
eukprot:11736115-Karenia_brevis.AAC.1